jgi:hypothetical protein
MKYSVLYCVYNNHNQFRNSLWTAACQHWSSALKEKKYEIIIVDNATPGDEIKQISKGIDPTMVFKEGFVRYLRIANENKRCTNITQGINLAASVASGEYIVIVADSNVLLSFNLLSKIDKVIDKDTLVLSTGPKNDVKISPGGSKRSEYGPCEVQDAARTNDELLSQMGWPCDPLKLRLLNGKHRFPPPHMARDCYIAAMPRDAFISYGGYDESQSQWGPYHEFFLDAMAKYLPKEHHLKGIRIIHQYHRVLKEQHA